MCERNGNRFPVLFRLPPPHSRVLWQIRDKFCTFTATLNKRHVFNSVSNLCQDRHGGYAMLPMSVSLVAAAALLLMNRENFIDYKSLPADLEIQNPPNPGNLSGRNRRINSVLTVAGGREMLEINNSISDTLKFSLYYDLLAKTHIFETDNNISQHMPRQPRIVICLQKVSGDMGGNCPANT